MALVRVKSVEARRVRAQPAVHAPAPPAGGPASIETMAGAKALRFTRLRLETAKREITALA